MFLPILIIISYINYSNTQQEPSITFISKRTITSLGEKVELVCKVTNAKNYVVQWLKQGPDTLNIISNGATTVLRDNTRYEVVFDHSTTYKLIIKSVREIDAGKYICRIEISSNRKDASVDLIVRVPPVITDDSSRYFITSINNPLISLQCFATGYPEPRISWRRGKNKLLPNGLSHYVGSTLNIYNVTKEDQGTYYCVADNGVKPGARRAIAVEVEYPPIIEVPKERVGQALNYHQILVCHVESFPSASIEWIKTNTKAIIRNNKNYNISIFPTNNEFVFTTNLQVNRIEKHNYGSYSCKASNKLGTTHKEIELFETQNIICPPVCGSNLKTLTGSSHSLHFTSNYTILYNILLVFSFANLKKDTYFLIF